VPNNASKWQMGCHLAFEGLKSPVPRQLNLGNIICCLMCIYAATELYE
jgi:hypothetical protein